MTQKHDANFANARQKVLQRISEMDEEARLFVQQLVDEFYHFILLGNSRKSWRKEDDDNEYSMILDYETLHEKQQFKTLNQYAEQINPMIRSSGFELRYSLEEDDDELLCVVFRLSLSQ